MKTGAMRVDRYGIERELGQGVMATVHLAKDVRHDRGPDLRSRPLALRGQTRQAQTRRRNRFCTPSTDLAIAT